MDYRRAIAALPIRYTEILFKTTNPGAELGHVPRPWGLGTLGGAHCRSRLERVEALPELIDPGAKRIPLK